MGYVKGLIEGTSIDPYGACDASEGDTDPIGECRTSEDHYETVIVKKSPLISSPQMVPGSFSLFSAGGCASTTVTNGECPDIKVTSNRLSQEELLDFAEDVQFEVDYLTETFGPEFLCELNSVHVEIVDDMIQTPEGGLLIGKYEPFDRSITQYESEFVLRQGFIYFDGSRFHHELGHYRAHMEFLYNRGLVDEFGAISWTKKRKLPRIRLQIDRTLLVAQGRECGRGFSG